jgi:hypothetical protein
MDYTIVVAASASDPSPLQYLAPYSAAPWVNIFVTGERCTTLSAEFSAIWGLETTGFRHST